MTLAEAKALKAGDIVHCIGCNNKKGDPMRAKVLSVKTWKTRQDHVLVSLKHGLYDYAKFNQDEISLLYKGED